MGRFYFQVSDAEGKVRKGTLEAGSLADARDVALKRGYTIIELREVAELAEAAVKVHTRPATARYHSGPAQPREFQPSLSQSVQAMLPATAVRAGMGTLAVVGLIWMLAGWKTPTQGSTDNSAARLATPDLNPLKLVVEGSVEVEPYPALGDVQVTVDLPDIPYQQTYEWVKLKHPRPGHFSLEIEFESTRRARHMIVRARKPGQGEASTEAIPLKPGGGKFSGLKLLVKAKK
ncbi:hypothetical protein IV102_04760 [bacterium]|nr:hypothetical protein [bacterium]